jgi:arabinose-5-phosphate isomerase
MPTELNVSDLDFCQSGKRVLQIEREGLCQLDQYINQDFASACQILYHCQGKVVVMGMGKSGHVGRKMAATFASTGTPAFFVHPAEASHGDLGMVGSADVVIAISNSGESNEILALIPIIKRLNIKLICISSNQHSSMAQAADVHLLVKVPIEACPLGLAPTSSTTATMVMGDALAVALLDARGFTVEDFALSHPGGSLGRKLLLQVKDIMHSGSEIPVVSPEASLRDTLLEITQKKMGMTVIVNSDRSIAGIFTDGDLRRVIDQCLDFKTTTISQVMTLGGVRVYPSLLAVDALNKMQSRNITSLLVEENNQLIGVVHLHDMLRSGVV